MHTNLSIPSNSIQLLIDSYVTWVDTNFLTGEVPTELAELGSPNQWLWGFGDGSTSNQQNPQHTYDEPGVYNVCLLVQDTETGCNADYCESVPVGVVSTREVTQQLPLIFFPNPVSREAPEWQVEGILATDVNQPVTFRLFDLQGKLVQQTELTGAETLRLQSQTDLPAGIYFAELRSERAVYRGRVVVQ